MSFLHTLRCALSLLCFFFLTAPATTEIYTLSLHDALPICAGVHAVGGEVRDVLLRRGVPVRQDDPVRVRRGLRLRSEEHTSELQSLRHLVCRLLLEKKKKRYVQYTRSLCQKAYIKYA